MSIDFYNREQIVNHLGNNSPTKYMYSFSKAPRFPILKKNGKSDIFYNIPSLKDLRSTSFGFGNKSDFTKNGNGTEIISIKRYFDKGKEPGPKFTFGLSREKFRKVFCPGFKIIDKDIPGPGKYNLFKNPGEDSPKYSIHEKCDKYSKKKLGSPGPANYTPLLSINSEGKYPISKMPNVISPNLRMNKVKRFLNKINDYPGPGSYTIKGLMGINFNSKYNSGKLISMHKRFKKNNERDNYPGPGSYSSIGEFGIMTPLTDRTVNNIRAGKNNKLSPIKKKENENSVEVN